MRHLAILLLALLAIAGTSAARTHRSSNNVRSYKVPRSSVQKAHRATAPRSKRATPRYSKRARTTGYQPAPRIPRSPTPERYKEIQQALADKGYYKGEVNGQWGADSTDALRQFQSDQNLKVDGKLGSLSLISLGLGPKRTVASQDKQGPPAPEPVSTPPAPQLGNPE